MVHYVLFISFILCITLNGIETLKIGVNSRACAGNCDIIDYILSIHS